MGIFSKVRSANNKRTNTMAHAHDRTLLASLGFNDVDKKDPLHDLGCQYLARPEIFNVLELVSSKGQPLLADHAEFERIISKGENQYRSTIGFLDTVVFTTIPGSVVKEGEKQVFEKAQDADRVWKESLNIINDSYYYTNPYRRWDQDKMVYVQPKLSWVDAQIDGPPVGFEVKISPVGLGDVLRQINLYRQYEFCDVWVLACAFEISPLMVEGLESHGILPVHLGEGFRKWVAEQHALPRAKNVKSI
jgi:hypothetical protein